MAQAFTDRRLAVLPIAAESALLLLALLALASLDRRSGSPDALLPLLAKGLVAVLVVQASLYYSEAYDLRAQRSRTELLLRLGRSTLLATLALPFLYYLVPQVQLGPRLLVAFLPAALVVVFLWHACLQWLWGRDALIDNVLILGTGYSAQQVAAELLRRQPLGYRVVGFVGEHVDEVGRSIINPTVVGTADDLLGLVARLRVSVIVVALDDRRGRLRVDDLLRCRVSGVRVEDAPTFYEHLTGKLLVSELRPSWLVFSPGFNKPRFPLGPRRFAEAMAAATLLLVFAPLLGLLAILIRLDSRGPALFRQQRVGLKGKVFELFKLRSMREDAEAGTGPAWTSSGDDPRVTRIGRLLRKLRLDELPQLVNIVRGEMSFVGPRPERPHFVAQLRRVIPYYDERHNVRPGITGWAQVKFGYGSTIEDAERKLQFDLYYIKNMTPILDVAIVLETFKVMLFGRGAR
jgi:sugar transferase (PEP-CTERM system associated)